MSQTPTLAKVITDGVDSRLYKVHTMLPGKVVAVDVTKGKCDVQPLLQRIDESGNPVTLPVITNCPIAFYRAGLAAVYLPVHVNDNVEIRFCERSLDIWLTKGGTIDPLDKRKHDLSDAVVYPGLYDFTQPPVGADPANLVVVNNVSKMTMQPGGQITLTSGTGIIEMTAAGKFKFQGASDELLQCVIDLIALLEIAQTPTMLGLQTFIDSNITSLAAIKTRVVGLKE